MNRGGSWNNNAQNCRSTNRNNNSPTNRNNNVGFRLVLSFSPAHGIVGRQPLNRCLSGSLQKGQKCSDAFRTSAAV
ncbi:hypothetical protein [Runella sp.]|uniref:hypothetical protein n=1 Tax=Runella sp. TaxID=1960881 RepID=UPI0038F81C51